MVTEFTDHICVTMDAELIMFLHDLVSAYLKEKEKGVVLTSSQSLSSRLGRPVVSTLSRGAAPNALAPPFYCVCGGVMT